MATEEPQAQQTQQKQNEIKRVTIYRNGDKNFKGRKVVINPHQLRTYDALLTQVTTLIRPNNGCVRSLRTPIGGSRIKDIDDLDTGRSYVACTQEKFKKLEYENIEEQIRSLQKSVSKDKESPRLPEIKPVVHNPRLQMSGRIKKVINEPCTIFVFTNEDELRPAARVLLQPRELQRWESIFAAVSERVRLRTGAIRWLFSLSGECVVNPNSLSNNEQYVAVGSEPFKAMNYGSPVKRMEVSPNLDRKRYDRGQYTKYKVPVVYTNKRSVPPSGATSQRSSQGNSTNASTNGSGNSQSTNRKKSPERNRQQRRALPQKNNYANRNQQNKNSRNNSDDVFRGNQNDKNGKQKTRETNYDNNGDDGGYRAKNSRESRDAREVEDSEDTKVDLPIDQVEAEEVDEDESPRAAKSKPTNQPTQKRASDDRNRQNTPPKRQDTPKWEDTPKRQDTPNRQDSPKGRENAKRDETPVRQDTPKRQETPKREASGAKSRTPSRQKTPDNTEKFQRDKSDAKNDDKKR